MITQGSKKRKQGFLSQEMDIDHRHDILHMYTDDLTNIEIYAELSITTK